MDSSACVLTGDAAAACARVRAPRITEGKGGKAEDAGEKTTYIPVAYGSVLSEPI